jgi:trk system potassium uptake protein
MMTLDLRPVVYVVGWQVLCLGALMLPSLAVDLYDRSLNAEAFAISSILAISAGFGIVLTCADSWTQNLSLRQGFLLTGGAWAFYPAVAALPMMLGEPGLSFTDAYFESMSALTTTGATVITGLEDLPRGLLLWRGILHWVGGIGIVLVAMILLPVLGIGGMQLLRTADFNTLGKILPRAWDIILHIAAVYLLLTMACILGYVWSGMSTFDAVVHAMSTLSTGGMGNYDASFAGFSAQTQYVSIVFMLLGGMSFIRFVQVLRGEVRAPFADSQIQGFVFAFAVFTVAILLARLLAGDVLNERAFRDVAFTVASLMTSTGFVATDYSLWSPLAVMLIFLINMVGGCSGSTAGGVKIFRYQLLFSSVFVEVRRLSSPNIVHVPRYLGRRVSGEVLDSVRAFFTVYFFSLAIISVLLVLLGLDFVTAVSGAATCLANVGPGLGPEIGPAGNFADLSASAKWVLSIAMLVGRLEIIAVFVLFTPAFWRG